MSVTLLRTKRRGSSMDEELISKKDLLIRYAISYGALYRWKRKGLIPEDWFIKKAAPTGQETFFPKELICKRVELILNQKDDRSLDDLSRQFRKEENVRSALVIKTVFGEKKIYCSDIYSVLLEKGDGTYSDITESILHNGKSET